MDLDDLEPLVDGIEDELDAVAAEVDDQVHVERVLVVVQDLHLLDRAHHVLDGGHGLREVHAWKEKKIISI